MPEILQFIPKIRLEDLLLYLGVRCGWGTFPLRPEMPGHGGGGVRGRVEGSQWCLGTGSAKEGGKSLPQSKLLSGPE
ncbi:hypothetical protein, partial [Enterocloster lavalensis]|uniref:hypothetical protein n=1 Tax=Enterocloster lavalensis TaxID=460384 RepID=UPI001D083061